MQRSLEATSPWNSASRPLDPDQFVFRGFGDELTHVRNRVRRLRVHTGEPTLAVVEDAVFVPASACVAAGRPEERGGFVDERGEPIPEAAGRRGLHAPLRVVPERTVEGDVLWLGWHFPHYGHFLLETLSRAWAVAEVDPSIPVLLHLPNDKLPGRGLERFLDAFGVRRERLLVIDAPTRVRRTLFPEPLYELSRWVHERAAAPYRAVARRVRGGARPRSQRPLYLSRRLLPSTQREVVGEPELEEVLKDNGFLIAYPEQLSLTAQLRLLAGDVAVFTVDGSAAHSVLFGDDGATLNLLADENPRMDHFLTTFATAGTGAFIRCLGDAGRGTPHVGGRYFPHLLNPEPLLGFLEERGFLAKGAGAARRFETAALRSQYSEAWLFARLRHAANPARPGPPLSPAEEQEAEDLSLRSWVLNLALARYFMSREPRRAAAYAARFAALVATEPDPARVIRYAEEAKRLARATAVTTPAVGARLHAAVLAHFQNG
jgi:hypothetical protein